MNDIQLLMEAVSPLFLFGAQNGGYAPPQLRGASFRGQLRYWYRTIHPGLEKAELENVESHLFGSTDLGSRVDIQAAPISNKSVTIDRYHVLPHRQAFQSNAISNGSQFKLDVSIKDELSVNPILKSLLLFTNLGGIGKRSRRGFGSLRVKKQIDGDDVDLENPLFALLSKGQFDNSDELIQHIGALLQTVIPFGINSSENMSLFPTGPGSANYPSFEDGKWCVLVCREHFDSYETAMRSFWQDHLRRYGILDDRAFGHTHNGRRASPFHLHLTESSQGFHVILTAFKAEPEPSQNYWGKHSDLFESCLAAYGGRLFTSNGGDPNAG